VTAADSKPPAGVALRLLSSFHTLQSVECAGWQRVFSRQDCRQAHGGNTSFVSISESGFTPAH